MSDKTVPVYANVEGERTQVGKASAADSGARSIHFFKKYAGTSAKDVEFGDEPLPATPVSSAPDAEQAAQPVTDAPDETLADDPTPETTWVDAEVEESIEDEVDEDILDEEENLPEDLAPSSAVKNDEDK